MKEKYIVALLGAAVVIFSVLSAICMMMQDRDEPVITLPEEDTQTVYEEGTDTSILLEGVRAWDKQDKDLTDEIRIDSVVANKDGQTAVVTYAVYDSANNVSKAKRTVSYLAAETSDEDDEKEDDADTDEAEEDDTDQADDGDTADETDTDETDDDETDTDDEDTDVTDEGEARTEEDTDTASAGSNPVITLSEHEFHIQRGGDFTPMNRVASATDDVDDQASLYRRFSVEGDYDVNVPGTYELRYFCMDSDGNVSNVETLTLVVE